MSWIAAGGLVVAGGTALYTGIKAKKAQNQLEGLKSPVYGGDKSISSFYRQALDRYNTNPYSSAAYKQQQQQIGRNVSTGLSAMSANGAGQGGVGRLLGMANDASLNSVVAAENQQNQRFGVLGNATGMKAQDDSKAFQINQQDPFERKYSLLAMKAAANKETSNQAMQNAFGAASSIAVRGGFNFNKTTTPSTSAGSWVGGTPTYNRYKYPQ